MAAVLWWPWVRALQPLSRKRLAWLRAIGAVAALLAAPLVQALPERWAALADVAFQRVVSETGVPNTLGPTAIAQDATGFLWIGTQDGLVRWDGYRFDRFRAAPGAAHALPDAYVQRLHVDAAGRLWVGTLSAGLARYRAESGDFMRVPVGPRGLPHPNVTSIADAPAGALWVGTDAGLSLVDAETGRLVRHIADFEGASPRVFSLLADRRGVLWVGTDRGLFRAASDGTGLRHVDLPGRVQATVTVLMEDERQRLWIGTRHAGVAVLDAADGAMFRPPAADSIGQHPVVAMAQAVTGEVWIATSDRGVLIVDPETSSGRWARNEPLLPQSLDDDSIWALHVDRSGLMWVGTGRSLLRHDPKAQAVLATLSARGSGKGLSGSQADALLALPDGHVWVGHASGIDVLDPSRAAPVGRIRADHVHPERALPESAMFAMQRSIDGAVHAATDRGLYRIDPATRRVQRVRWAAREPGKAVWALLADGDALWVGGQDGIWRVRPGSTPVAAEAFDIGLPDHRVELLAHAPQGRLWVGTRSGLLLLDVGRRTAVPYLQGPWVPPGLGTVVVNALMHDVQADRLWLGTASVGILVVDAPFSSAPKVQVLGVEQGLPNLNISGLLRDAQDRVWASTDDGLVVVTSSSLAAKALGSADGVQIATYWAHSAAATPEGELLFGGLGGLTVVRPDRLQAWRHQPAVVLTQVRIDGAIQPATALHAAARALTLAPGTRSVAVEFSSLDFSAPERNRYAYRLRGFEDRWTEVPANHRVATYTNLPPGDFVLQVRGSNREQEWSGQELSIALSVQPAWHQTAAFRILIAALSLAGLYAVVQARTLWLQRQRRQLEALVTERTAALEQRTAELVEGERKLAEMAYTDSLTGLANRRRFELLFNHHAATARRQGVEFALALIDLDRFKQINDTLGHAAGDALLVEVARRLLHAVRDSDAVARLGGDEFALLISSPLNDQTAAILFERILAAFDAPVPHEGRDMRTSLSIGVAVFPRDGDDLDQLYAKADAALYRAKAAGRNTWRSAERHA
jgi:diguanylate cyclase (GGDEF)-like protein